MGTSRSRLKRIWSKMKSRCYSPKVYNYHRYGGRGITVCDEWKDNFQAFYDWAIANGYADDLTIDRIDNDGNYEPNNCRWATMKEQANNKSNNVRITYKGKTQDIKQWSEELGIAYTTLFIRIHNGWPVEKAFFEPVKEVANNRYPEVITEPGERRDLKVREYLRRRAGIRTEEQRRSDDRHKVQNKVAAIHDLLKDNLTLSVREIAKITGIPKSTVQRLKQCYLDIQKH